MFEFKGIDLNTKYVRPSTWDWLVSRAGDDDAPFEGYLYDNFCGKACGLLLWTYSVDPQDDTLPEDLLAIVREAYDREWRFIVLDGDGADCELFEDLSAAWDVS